MYDNDDYNYMFQLYNIDILRRDINGSSFIKYYRYCLFIGKDLKLVIMIQI